MNQINYNEGKKVMSYFIYAWQLKTSDRRRHLLFKILVLSRVIFNL
jgi:hypothetical protein